ncbi:hypothetical protein [Spiribacter roseus]|uniref:hypothetical protein n=1 Tax=Spiribacter roseus TaxID=1855875 RepID=UPI0012FDDAB1
MSSFSGEWLQGNYTDAGDSFSDIHLPTASEKDLQGLSLFETLHVAEAARLQGRAQLAVSAYDATEQHFKRFDVENFGSTAASQASAVLLNDNVMSYRGYLYEAVLANTYKGVAFLELGDAQSARVEFNRAEERSRRAAYYFRQSIAAQREALEEEAGSTEAGIVSASLGDADTQRAIRSNYGAPSEWSVYKGFVNPFTTYMHGLFRLATANTSGDYEQAASLLERVAGVSSNATVAEDVVLANAMAAGRGSASEREGLVWVVYDNGVGPRLQETRIDLPLAGIGDGSVYYAGIALPSITEGQPLPRITVRAGNGEFRTQELASMKRIMNTEFQARLDGILVRSLTSAVVKVAAQAAAEEEFGAIGGLAAGIASAATTQADLRVWRALPARWETIRFARPASGSITLNGLQPAAINVSLPDWPMTMVYVRKTGPNASATVRVVDLSGRSPAASGEGVVIAKGAEK